MLKKQLRQRLERSSIKKQEKALADAKNAGGVAETAKYYREVIMPSMEAVRTPIDALEEIVDGKFWPVPTYGELMFEV